MTIHFLRKILKNFQNFPKLNFFRSSEPKIRFGGRKIRFARPNFRSGKKILKNFEKFPKFSLGNVWS